MKKIFFILIASIITSAHLSAQSCLPEGIIFETQEQIDSFPINYPGCTTIEGSVEVYSYYIINLNGLSNLDSILGNLNINHSNVYGDLSGLDNLAYVGGNLFLINVDYLENLEGLENLTYINGDLRINGNYRLSTLNGLNNLIEIGGSLTIDENRLIPDLNGFDSLLEIGGDLNIYRNEESLNSLTGIESLTSINGSVTIHDNLMLSELTGLDNINPGTITHLTISDNNQLSFCDVQSICDYLASPNGIVEIFGNGPGCNNPGEIANSCGYELPCLPYGNYYFSSQSDIDSFDVNFLNCNILEGDVIILGNDISNLNGLAGIDTIMENLVIGEKYSGGNPVLASLQGLDSLSFVGGDLLIGNNHILTGLYGLGNVTTINGNISVGYNPVMTSLNGFIDLSVISGSLEIRNNESLTDMTGLDNISTISGNLYIHRNTGLINLNGLNALSSIGMDLYIGENNSIISLEGLENLESAGSIAIGSWAITGYQFHCEVGNPKLESIAALNSLNTLGQSISIVCNTSLPDLNGLENISTIPGDLIIVGNDALVSFDGLSGLHTIEGDLQIGLEPWYSPLFPFLGNASLVDIMSLSNLSYIGGTLNIGDNELLASLAGLENLTFVGSDLNIVRNESLGSIYELESIAGGSIDNLAIAYNTSLVSCESQTICEYLSSPGGVVNIFNNAPGCESPGEIASKCGFPMPCLPYGNYYFSSQAEIDNFQSWYADCDSLQGNVTISGSDITNLGGLSDVTLIENYLGIQNNPVLINLNGLDNLTSTGGSLSIRENASLLNISGLNNLASIEGFLIIRDNDTLLSLSGLDNIWVESINDITINGNQYLSHCEVESVCKFIANNYGWSSISDNASGCNSEEEVLDACNSVAIDEFGFDTKFKIYPNPCSGAVRLRYTNSELRTLNFELYSIDGVLLRTLFDNMQQPGEYELEFDVSDLPGGMYFVRMQSGESYAISKLVVIH